MGILKTYKISTDVSNSKVNSDKLHDEISESGNIIDFEGIIIIGDDLSVLGDSFSDEGATDALISDHDDTIPDVIDHSVYGSQFQSVEFENESTTTSSKYTIKAQLITPNLPLGNYLIEWFNETRGTDKKSIIDVRVLIGEEEIASTIIEPNDKDDWYPQSGFRVMSLSGINTINLQYRNEEKGSVKIRRARIKINRVS